LTDELIAELVTLAGRTAEEIAGVPDEMVAGSLAAFRDMLEGEMADLGPDVAKQIADAFMATVTKAKWAIESATPELGTVH
jgi:hypothetical protein